MVNPATVRAVVSAHVALSTVFSSNFQNFSWPLAVEQILSDTGEKANMTKRLYVGGLPYHVTDEILENLFSAYGTVESANVMINKITDLSDGFGFVEMSSESEAQAAIHNLHGTEVEGQTIKVNEARPRLVRGKVFKRDRW